ncbi:MAG: DUF1611 domain-containing protein [Kordiimonadaceae bacterium]|nr:DUF1611 domain-containing protein [Kordiimonadaceae bacterium]
MQIQPPYLLFLGDTNDPLAVKTSRGVAQWRPEKCLGEHAIDGCSVSLGLPNMSIKEAAEKGAKTFILGLANAGGTISESWIPSILEAMENGMDIANGLHQRLTDIPTIKHAANRLGCELFDVRHASENWPIANGTKRPGKRILTVGSDCSVGKMYTSLALEKELLARGKKASFCATGQTGILICGSGISVDAVIADFISGAIEAIAPATDEDHWTIIEGQGSLFHPSFAGVSLGLLHGAQPDIIIQCLEVGRTHMRGLPNTPQPDLADCIALNLQTARLTSPAVKLGGIAINSSSLSPAQAEDYCAELATRFSVPCTDPLRHGVATIVDGLF